jgi:NAD(P)-dependent dehydrogenase (short-subunit alcohol dehydrogenase family)
VALITGAARRIGRAIAESLARDGYAIAVHASARSHADAVVFASELRAAGATAHAVAADLMDEAAPEKLFAEVGQALGPVTLLVNNASLFETDLMMRELPEDRHGAIVNITDQRVWRLNPHYFSYTLTKAALWTATQTMAQAFAPRIRVNAVGPGPVFPNTTDGAEGFAREAASIPMARPVLPEEIAEAVAYLARARSITGQMIAVDGGQHIAWKTPDVIAGN